MIIGDLSLFGYELEGQPVPPPDPPGTQLLIGLPAGYNAFDSWGAVTFPTTAQSVGTPAGDPCIATILDFIQKFTCDDGNITVAWAPVFPGSVPIKTVHQHDPKEVVFNVKDLPALYMWRDGSTQDWAAEDWLRETTTVKALWVFPLPGVQEFQRIRAPFMNTLCKGIAVGIERGRTPSFLIPGDLEPRAQREGSLFYPAAAFEAFFLKSWKPAKLLIQANAGAPVAYPACEITFELTENLEYGLGRFPAVNGTNITITNSAGRVVDAGPAP